MDSSTDIGSHDGGKVLSGLTALIIGGGRGIGRSVALAFGRAGASVAVAARTQSEISAVADECGSRYGPAISVVLDITDRESCHAAVERTCQEWGRIDVLVNSAGVATAQKFTDIDDATWQRTLDVDLTGPFMMIRAVLPGMLLRRSGAVITISSIAGKVGAPYIAPYNAAKHGVLGLMRSLASEYARSGVSFNSVCPGYVDTSMTESAVRHIMVRTGRTRDAALAALVTPQGRLIRPEEVADVCLLLASPGGRSINGQAINVDGGAVQS